MILRELYCKLPTDLDYEAKVESNDEAFNILQQIKIVLGTKPGEVLGNPMFGCDLEKYLFSMDYNKEEILSMINYEIFSNVHFNENRWTIGVDVLFGHSSDSPYEYAVIDISLNEQKCLGIIVGQQ